MLFVVFLCSLTLAAQITFTEEDDTMTKRLHKMATIEQEDFNDSQPSLDTMPPPSTGQLERRRRKKKCIIL